MPACWLIGRRRLVPLEEVEGSDACGKEARVEDAFLCHGE